MSWQLRNIDSSAQPKVTRSVNYYLNSMTRHLSPYHQRIMRLIDHHVAGTKWQLKPNIGPPYLAVKAETKLLKDTCITCGRT